MTYCTLLAGALLRAALISSIAGTAAYCLRSWLAKLRGVMLAVLIVPFLLPPIAVAYAYTSVSQPVILHPVGREFLYGTLVLIRFFPLFVILYIWRGTHLRTAQYCLQLYKQSRLQRLKFHLLGPGRWVSVGMLLMMILVFAEFEMAAVLNMPVWSVIMFDSLAGGVPPAEMLLKALPALGIQLAVLAAAVFLTIRTIPIKAKADKAHVPGPIIRAGGWFAAAVIVLAALAVPFTVLAAEIIHGGRGVWRDLTIGRDIASSLVIAGSAMLLTAVIAGWLVPRINRLVLSPLYSTGLLVLCLPGLMGGFLSALLVLNIFLLPGLQRLYTTPLPLIICLVIQLLPIGIIMRILHMDHGMQQQLHCARLSGSRPVQRRLIFPAVFRACAVFFILGFYELPAASLLAPPAMTPVMVRLHNFMHYGHTARLSLMVIIGALIPVFILIPIRFSLPFLYGKRIING